MKIANIENWSIKTSDDNLFRAPELKNKRLCGNVYNHPNFEDGKPVHSSSIQDIDLVKGRVVTRNTVYQLGKVDKDYLAYCEKANVKDLDLLKKYGLQESEKK